MYVSQFTFVQDGRETKTRTFASCTVGKTLTWLRKNRFQSPRSYPRRGVFGRDRSGDKIERIGRLPAHSFVLDWMQRFWLQLMCTRNPFLDGGHPLDCSPANLNGLRKSLSDFKLISNWWFWETGICPRDFSKPQTDICLNKLRMLPLFEKYQKDHIPQVNFTFVSSIFCQGEPSWLHSPHQYSPQQQTTFIL